jgi:leader peptidase (prepilin peptidase) / N-methyltransferase
MEVTLALLFGLVIGSFLNVCILRLPQEVSVTKPRSRCPQCKKLIPWYDNVPILSYVLLGARCRYCKAKISARYPLVEAANGLVSVLLYLKYGLTTEWFIYLVFSGALIVLAFIDLDHRILPDLITLNGIWIGILASIFLAEPSPLIARVLRMVGVEITNPRVIALIASLFGVVVGGGLLWGVAEAYVRFRGIEGLGFGDVKMMAMVGAFLGAPLTLLTIMIGSLVGSIIGLAFIRLASKSREYELPFGTFLSLAGIISVLYGNDLIRWYITQMIQPNL